MQDVANPTA